MFAWKKTFEDITFQNAELDLNFFYLHHWSFYMNFLNQGWLFKRFIKETLVRISETAPTEFRTCESFEYKAVALASEKP